MQGAWQQQHVLRQARQSQEAEGTGNDYRVLYPRRGTTGRDGFLAGNISRDWILEGLDVFCQQYWGGTLESSREGKTWSFLWFAELTLAAGEIMG